MGNENPKKCAGMTYFFGFFVRWEKKRVDNKYRIFEMFTRQPTRGVLWADCPQNPRILARNRMKCDFCASRSVVAGHGVNSNL